ncbi:hypothetical protein [Egbenema bharatensis]|uniref:hypothetical protein n=1 Tax=Egbenema bharatensis TaxID=3463334 RepID=UPI003A89408C
MKILTRSQLNPLQTHKLQTHGLSNHLSRLLCSRNLLTLFAPQLLTPHSPLPTPLI